MAIEALAGRDAAFLDYARLDAYLHEWKTRDEAASEAKRIHRASLGPDIDLEALGNAVMCPMFRVTRLYKFVCDAGPTAIGCNIGGWGSDFPARIHRIMKTST